MFITKTSKFFKNYFNIFDKNGYILVSILMLGIILISYAMNNSFSSFVLNIKELYGTNHFLAWSTPKFDIYIPFISSIIICASFFKDYNGKTVEIMTFYSKGKVNQLVFIKWIVYTTLIVFLVIIAAVIEYRVALLGFKEFGVLIIRTIPPLIYMNSIALFFSVICKNVNAGISVSFIYILVDILSDGRYAKFLALSADTFYFKSVEYYYINRISLVIMTIIFVLISCKKALRVK